jgi:glutamyl-tRNA reductase
VAALPGVTRIDLAVIGNATAHDEEAASRAADLAAARAIIADEVAAFAGRQRADQAAPTVVALRAMADEVVEGELHRMRARLPDADPAVAQELESTIRRVVDKLLHAPSVRVKELAMESGGHTYTEALRELFALDPQSVVAVEAIDSPEVDRDDDRGDP